jgi:SulP family sulfate permease
MTPALAAWLPKSVLLLRDYDRRKFLSDLIAGVTVGLVALPLAMAFAIASGVTPQAGIYCAIVTGFLISALGGSKTQIGGPTGAFVVVVSGIIAKYGIEGLFTCTMMAGLLLLILGITGMGSAVKYFPRPVIIGFTNGIAILIASTQIRDFFGLRMISVPGDFFHRIRVLAGHQGAHRPQPRMRMIERRPFQKLPGEDLGWLKAKRHFSLSAQDSHAWRCWGSLRIWNDDEIAPDTGFPPHAHANM